jgi:ribosomal protein L37AE/L43A
MKRSGFKRKATVPMKRTSIKRKSKSSTRKLQDELWQECRRIAIEKYKQKDGTWKCFTCGKPIDGSNKQLGHFIPNSVGGALLRYNLDNLRLQCYYCNINLGGNGSTFYKNLLEENGQEYINKLFQLKGQTTKAEDHYKKLLTEYKSL